MSTIMMRLALLKTLFTIHSKLPALTHYRKRFFNIQIANYVALSEGLVKNDIS